MSDVKRWYIVQAYSGSETYVMQALRDQIRLEGLEEYFDDILVPTEKVVSLREGRKHRTDQKFFPGYVLIKMELNDKTWHLVRNTRKVIGFIGGKSDRPAPLSEKEANAILQRIQEGVEKPKPKVRFEPGENVRVVAGPFADFNGIVEEVNYEKNRLQVSVLIFGRSTPVELEFSQVEKT